LLLCAADLLVALDSMVVTVALPAFLIGGFTFARAFVPFISHGMSGMREGESGLASGLFQTSTHLGGALVLALLATSAAAGGHRLGLPRRGRAARAGPGGGCPHARAGPIRGMMRGGCCCSRSRSASPSG
jgi:hypothetical protein